LAKERSGEWNGWKGLGNERGNKGNDGRENALENRVEMHLTPV